ncbi:hypothetical protein AcV5_001438 [Taiwanofungus camphoratus]|nr:hypothetical protein AcV5_001438 [Antrodia cinnamomea]
MATPHSASVAIVPGHTEPGTGHVLHCPKWELRLGLGVWAYLIRKLVCAWKCVCDSKGAFTLRAHSGRPPSDPHPRSAPARRQPQRANTLTRRHTRLSRRQPLLARTIALVALFPTAPHKLPPRVAYIQHSVTRVAHPLLVEHAVDHLPYRRPTALVSPVCIYNDSYTRFVCSAVLVAALAVDVLNLSFSSFSESSSPISAHFTKSTLLLSDLPSLASSITARCAPSFSPSTVPHPSGEEFINRSLLDSVDAQADAEPISSSSDSEAAGTSVNTFGSLSTTSSMSIGSPTAPYHISMQSQQQPPRPDSPNNTMIPSHLKSAPHSADPYNSGAQNMNTSHSMYNSMNIHSAISDYTSLASTEPDALNFQSKANGFASAPFRTSTSFNPFPARSRHPPGSYRDSTSSFGGPAYSAQSGDIFNVQNSLSHISTTQSQNTPSSYGFEPMHHPGRVHDFPAVGPQSAPGIVGNGVSQAKQLSFTSMDPYRQGLESALLQPHQLSQQSNLSGTPGVLQTTQASQMTLHQQGPQQSFQGSYVNGMSHGLSHTHQGALQSHSQFGPSLSANGSGSGPGAGGQGAALTGASGMNHVNGSAQNQQQEEISTIFVVGFPEDMQEREFTNMFTFSSGFEAATLKIPNKEFTAYGSAGAPTGPNARLQYPGANDPYNLVTVNQGGVVIDGGRDGLTTSWPAAAPMQPNDEGHFISSNIPAQPPRKQIIGFAKFRTRQEALEARDILQGRRVDNERGAVLKAEMAKKNLHMKRGPGVAPGMPLSSLMNGSAGSVPPETLATFSGLNSLAGLSANGGAGETLAQRDRELGALGAMGIVGLGQRRERMIDGREEEDRDRRRDVGAVGVMNLGALGIRGARERAEEDERERERKRKEKESARLRQNSFAFEAFHSVPQQMVRQGANSLMAVESGVSPNCIGSTSYPLQSEGPVTNGISSGPWGNLRDVGASAALRKMSAPLTSNLPARPSSPLQHSSSANVDSDANLPSAPLSASSQSSSMIPGGCSAPFSPQSNASSLPSHPSLPSRPRPYSPSSEPQQQQTSSNQPAVGSSSLPTSSASSASGSQSGHDEDFSRSIAALAVSTNQGTTSPQLPSPASGASSAGTGRNPGDQNPPINTLYVGNLPTSLAPGGFPLNYLEDRLRELFSRRPGYRKLCFRQKSNGPMCFVEFEDVNYATKALNELYGNTLNGLVKGGGIRLSYSKNPLGVRTPTSGGNGSSLQYQQQQGVAPGQPFINDTFQSRQGELEGGRTIRRDTSGMTSPTSSYHYTTSPPPPRFISPPPSAPFPTSLTSSTTFPRANSQGYGLASASTSSFSPFGISPSHSTIPDQPSADASNDHLSHNLSSTTPNLEASRVG